MGTYRKRWNEKARAGQMSKLKELKRVRNKQFTRAAAADSDSENDSGSDNDDSGSDLESKKVPEDTNVAVLKPLTEEEKLEKKRKLEELFTPKETKISRTKKKRLEKFIEHQLKREEKKVLIEKLQDYKIDTSLLTSSKNLGHGRKTKRQEIEEALKLEKQGLADEKTKEILYDEVEVKDWYADHPDSAGESDREEEDDDEFSEVKSGGFVDNRPSKFGGSGFGFGFANAKVVTKKTPKKKYNWRQKVEQEERKRRKQDDDQDFSSSEDEDEDEESENEDSVDGSSENNESSSGDEEQEESAEEEEEEEEEEESKTTVAEEFKQWANQEIKKLEGRDVEVVMPKMDIKVERIERIEDMDDGLQGDNFNVDENLKRKAFYVKVQRSDEVQLVRTALPVFAEEYRIMEAINHNDVVIICGETGSGKTTQVPQFLYESGYGNSSSADTPGMIGITQPRRVAAVSMANRVSNEMGDHGGYVGYQIRFDSSTKQDTRMKFMTDGVLLREMMNDFKLTKYSSIIIDEAHERNINTDILIGMLSRCVRLRAKERAQDPVKNKKLKLIIMSATLRVSDFSENPALFPTPPPVLKVDARQYPVAVHFNRKTKFDYAEEAFRKTCKIHQRLPPGAILVFMTGQQEITHMVKRLRKEFPFPKRQSLIQKDNIPTVRVDAATADVEAEDVDFSVVVKEEMQFEEDLPSDEEGSDAEEEEEGFEETLEEGQTDRDPLYVLPLYSLLPTKEQMKVFRDPPPGSRLCVVATNVAETSLTIPGVRYVVDCGRSKERKFDETTGVQSFEIDWISKASADQRSGRAGRTGPGHCYRLYSSAVYERDFEQFSKPEILRMPVESIVLQMKSMAIHNIINFPFPTPPDPSALAKAQKLLQYLGALDNNERITEDGRAMSLFPLSPRFAKMLLVGNENDCLKYVVTIVSALSVGEPFLSEQELGISSFIPDANASNKEDANKNEDDEEDVKRSVVEDPVDHEAEERKRALRTRYIKSSMKFNKLDKFSDVLRLLSAVSALDYIPKEQHYSFMHKNFLREKTMEEILKLRKQVMFIIKSVTSKESVAVQVKDEDLKSSVPTETQIKLLKQMITAGFIDQVAIRADQLFPEDVTINKSNISSIPYVPVLAEKTSEVEDLFVYIHPNSILNQCGEQPPKYLVFHSLHINSNNERAKTRMKTLCDIKSTPLANVARKGSLLTYGKPITGQGLKPIDISPTERYCYVVPRFGSPNDSDIKVGWELNPIPVHQVKEHGVWTVKKLLTPKAFKSHQVKH
ncbi:putative ATP-dependent RNA helicase DHR1 [Kluyveromyces marxianus]|nr:putative ATP-dependent RNA helicase DHR1 [Kluyveromyces marxianus]KAG0684298.1 putative ATP-dependent RNA helicase DHR1 [Kluyveromyces marxianus]